MGEIKLEIKQEIIKKIPKKRGRKSKKEKEALLKKQLEEGIPVKKVPKKRGRKPKGGKIICSKNIKTNEKSNEKQNIILHLKCSSEDLIQYKTGSLLTENEKNIKAFDNTNGKLDLLKINNDAYINEMKNNIESKTDDTDNKLISEKIKKLKINLRHNNVLQKRSSCFWCTYPFDSPSIFIPKHQKNDSIEVYGCFCSPECAVSYLKNELIDDSTRWERYTLLNNLYSKIYNYDKNIKPAPNPFYTLDRYYGNLTIQEYRKLLKNERLLMIVEKPLTKILPELCEENNELPNIFGNILNENNNQNKYRLKRSEPKNTKKNMMKTNFNFS